MTGLHFILAGACLLAFSGFPGLFADRRARWGEIVSVGMIVLGAACGLLGALLPDSGTPVEWQSPWGLPWGRFSVALDPLSRVFLLPVFLGPAIGAVYGLGYWSQRDHPESGRRLRLFFGLMPAAMAFVLVARDGALFLLAWEIMALAAFFLVTTEEDQAEARTAGWIYFVATHVGTLSLLAVFALLRHATGSFALTALDAVPSVCNAVFLLGLLGFGLKAGLMPLHVWLPGAHASAPSHVSAMLSGVMLKMGIYGLVRVTSLLPAPPTWWGATLLAGGALSAVLGLVFALAQHDLKRLLAYSSIENVGIIAAGLGLALLGRSTGETAWVALGLGGALLHAWNHSLFKPLLFLGAGSVIHAAGTRRVDLLGGLARRMPCTAGLFLVGAVAICALPPLNGFASELLLYLGLFRTIGLDGGGSWPAAAGAIPAIALAGALAAAAFAKLVGAAFLGEPRSEHAGYAHESPATMLAPMTVLALLCLAIGSVPLLGVPLLDKAVAAWWPGAQATPIANIAPLRWFPFVALAILALAGAILGALRLTMASAPRPVTWDCGYAAPTARMQYTGSSFAQSLVSLFSWALWPRVRRARVAGLFPAPPAFHSEVPDAVLDRALLPALRAAAAFLRWARLLQQGQIQVYVLHVLLTVLALFVSTYLA